MAEETAGGRISAIRTQKRRTDRANIFLDGRFALSVKASLAQGLHEGDWLSAEALGALAREDSEGEAYRRGLEFLAHRPRSRWEVRRRLLRRGIQEEAADAVLGRLADEGLLGDEEFARAWVENREQFRPRSHALLRSELRGKRVDEDAIEAALTEVREEDSCRKAALLVARRYVALDNESLSDKLMPYLRRRGFSWDLSREAVAWVLDARSSGDLASIENETDGSNRDVG
ncbi:MAG: regulatory protein RecX [Anaerolineae bacterium]